MTVVDTPGTNAIIKEQTRLTKGFIPQSDLVCLFYIPHYTVYIRYIYCAMLCTYSICTVRKATWFACFIPHYDVYIRYIYCTQNSVYDTCGLLYYTTCITTCIMCHEDRYVCCTLRVLYVACAVRCVLLRVLYHSIAYQKCYIYCTIRYRIFITSLYVLNYVCRHTRTHTRTHPPTHTHTQVIFVTSAERPVTETEGKLLGYIKEWGKKVVMVLNKVRLNVFSLDCLL